MIPWYVCAGISVGALVAGHIVGFLQSGLSVEREADEAYEQGRHAGYRQGLVDASFVTAGLRRVKEYRRE